MKISHFFIVVLVCFSSVALSQKNKVLFTIDDTPYYTDEFVRIYNKNLHLVKDESQKDIDNYLDLYMGYKLKIKKAYQLNLHEESKYKDELRTYREQLSKNYISDTEITDQLVEEAYDRSLKEIRASHILISIDPYATPQDTLIAYRKIQEIRQRAIRGDNFEVLANEFSDDPSVKQNLGDLGYFSVFKMVYPFETAAYNTKLNEISPVVRSNFGYHIIKVKDIRDNRGQITVAHIMIGKSNDETERRSALGKLGSIYQKLMQGENFESLAKQFSEDKNSAERGGNIGTISSGQLMSTIFEDAAFAIENVGEISKIIETEFGWHIIKLIEKHPLKSFEEAQKDIRIKLKIGDRSKVADKIMSNNLKEKYKPKVDYTELQKILEIITEDYYKEKFEVPENTVKYSQTVIKIGGEAITGVDFLQFASREQGLKQRIRPLAMLKSKLIEDFVDFSLKKYHSDNLENEFPEFKYIMDEYREGLLLFDLMEREIWGKAQNDTIAQRDFYQKNIDNYLWNQRIEAIVASSVNREFVEKTKEYFEQGKSVDFIKENINKDSVNIMIDQGLYEEESNGLPEYYEFSIGVSDIYKQDDYYYVILGKQITPSAIKTFEEAKSKVVNDYQEYLENNWIDSLREEFKCKVKKRVFKKLKKRMK